MNTNPSNAPLAALTGAERRRARRFSVAGFAEAFVIESGLLFRGEIRDISETGCYLETKARLKVECSMLMNVTFTLRGRTYQMTARIMNVRPGKGVGAEFLFTNEAERKLFNQLFYEVSH